MPSPQSPDQPNPASFRSCRMIPYSPEKVFAAFATPELLTRFWGPAGFTNTFELFDFKVGGHWKFVMHGPNGADYPNENVFTQIDTPTTWAIEHIVPPHFTLTVTLAAQDGGTSITWLQEFKDLDTATKIKHIVEPANEQNLDRLVAVLAGKAL